MARPLSPHEVETLRQFENAAMLRDLKSFAGWTIYRELAAGRIQEIRDKYENTNMDKDATWAAKIALQAVRDFQKSMEELVDTAQDILDPDAMKRMIEETKIADYDGEIGLRILSDDV